MITALKKTIGTLLCVLALASCTIVPLPTEQPRGDEGGVFVYVQPFPREAAALRFTLKSLSAVREDGKEFPLALAVNEFAGPDMARQRLIARGNLPEGRYTGFLLVVQRASTATEEQGTADLLVPEAPQKAEFAFAIEKRTALVIAFSLRYAESLQTEYSFNPRFHLSVPQRPLAELTGYASNAGDDTVTLFNKATEEATGVIVAGRGPRAIALNLPLKKAYVALSGDDAIAVIDVNEGIVIDRIMLNQGDNPVDLALTPDGQTLVVVNAASDTVSFVDTVSRLERKRILVGRNPCSLVLNSAGKRAFVANRLSNSLSVIDIPYQAVSGTIPTGPEPLRAQFNRTGDRLYVIHAAYPYLFVIDPSTFSTVQQQFIGSGVAAIKVDTWNDLLYLVKKNDTMITLFNPITFAPVGYIPTRGIVEYMTIDNATNSLYAAVPERNSLVIFNLVNRKPVAEIDVNRRPSWISLPGER